MQSIDQHKEYVLFWNSENEMKLAIVKAFEKCKIYFLYTKNT